MFPKIVQNNLGFPDQFLICKNKTVHCLVVWVKENQKYSLVIE